jgi:hypothetical protein
LTDDDSFALPPRRCSSVFEHDASGVELGTDAIGFGEIPGPAGGTPGLDLRLDFLDRHRRLFVLHPAERQHTEHAIELLERFAHLRRVTGTELAGVD